METVTVLMLAVQFITVLAVVRLRQALRRENDLVLGLRSDLLKTIRADSEALDLIRRNFARLDGRVDKVVDLYVKMRVADMDEKSKREALGRLEKELSDDDFLH
jgi:predicted transcriptional regulator